MDLTIETTRLEDNAVTDRLAAVGKWSAAAVDIVTKAVHGLILSACKEADQRSGEIAAIGFGMTGYTPL